MCMGITLFRILLHHTLNKGHGGIKIEYLHLIASPYSLTLEKKVISNRNKRKMTDEGRGDGNTPEERKRGKLTPSFFTVLRMYKNKTDVTRYLFKSLYYTGIDKNLDSTYNVNSRLFLPLISMHDLEILCQEIDMRNTHFKQMKKKRASQPFSSNHAPNLAALTGKFVKLIFQKKGFPKGGLEYISTHISKDTDPPRPTVFVDVTKEAEERLKDHSFVMKTLTLPIGLWRVSGKNESV